jgi:hypothetical protein
MGLKVKPIKLKSLDEIIDRFRELVHRHRRRFLKRNLRPCPYNCTFSSVVGRSVVGCGKCGSHNPEFCKQQERFVPLYSKEELSDQFRRALRDPKILLKDYRDLVVFLWALGQFDSDEEAISEHIIQKVEQHDE